MAEEPRNQPHPSDPEGRDGLDLHEAALAYQDAFGEVPTIAGLPPGKLDQAAQLLADAVEDEKPFTGDAEWWAALGLDPPDDDDLI